MSLKIYDPATRSLRDFEPFEPSRTGIYLHGTAVQGAPHIGHMRSVLAFDALARWLRRSEHDTRAIYNVTDIDDKILRKSAETGHLWWKWAYRLEREFSQTYRTLGVLPPTYESRAIGHIADQIEFAQAILNVGHAYVGGPGNVYFDVASPPDYGSLARQSLTNITVDEPDVELNKRSLRGFALWKAPRPSEPATATWATSWGKDRPGWHIECSAMAGCYLDETFDTHSGGIDLRLPYYENEQAQLHTAGRGFARYWMHSAWVAIEGEEMSKSLGNFLTVEAVAREVPSVISRSALRTVHYRSTVAYSPAAFVKAQVIWDRPAGFIARTTESEEVGLDEMASLDPDRLLAEFATAMGDNLNVSGALTAVHEAVTEDSTALSERDSVGVGHAQLEVRSILDILGLDPLSPQWQSGIRFDVVGKTLDALVADMPERHAQARATKGWTAVGAMRDSLSVAGVVVEDSPEGTR